MLRCSLTGLVALLMLLPMPASAHGPCGCLTPSEGPPGTNVRVASPLYKVIFNPDRADLAIGPETLWDQHHGGPPMTLFRQTWRYSERPLNDGGSFVVPSVAPGRYLVALYDGGEGGQHYSWETFTVLAGGPKSAEPAATKPAVARSPSSGGVSVPLFVGAVLVALGAGLAGAAVVRRHRRHRTAQHR